MKTLEFKIYPVSPLPEPEASETEDETDAFDTVEDLTEEVPTYLSKPDFALTNFGDNVSEDIPELSSVLAIPKGPDDAIVEEIKTRFEEKNNCKMNATNIRRLKAEVEKAKVKLSDYYNESGEL